MQRHDVQVVVEVVPELAGRERGTGIAVGGGHYPGVEVHGFSPADPEERSLPQSAEQPGLHRRVEVEEIGKKQGTSVRLFQVAVAHFAALLGAEEHHRAVMLAARVRRHADEGTRAPVAHRMQVAGADSLAASRFP